MTGTMTIRFPDGDEQVFPAEITLAGGDIHAEPVADEHYEQKLKEHRGQFQITHLGIDKCPKLSSQD